ncbi:hypothetical protein V495_02075 [Pseudogymnoascus sp. VKM F-4514 (FW-929)]|nr:hypothetical protein V495_02075 [Pseudogymnoascus sp. VKM F-4514 (FW-929)]KFY52565.1 hypothetical protein V497_08490 [Pseudogymnoascus sp. VKM F-4516 (FW-969)]
MQLLNLPDELLLDIGSRIRSQSDLNALSRANRYLDNLLNPELYHRDALTKKSMLWAAEMGRPETLKQAQSFGIVSDLDTGRLLHLAAANGRVSILEYLLPVEPNGVLNDPQFDGDRLTTPLAAACRYGHDGAVKILLDHGADHSVADDRGFQPLHLAATFGSPIVAELLLDSGADISAVDAHRWMPLHFACVNGKLAAAELLIDRGADIFAKCLRLSQNSLSLAVRSGNTELVKLIISKGYHPMGGVYHEEHRGTTLLHRVARQSHLEIAKLLVSCGSQVSAKTKTGATVLDWAVMGGSVSMVRFILQSGAEIATTNTIGVSALHLAAVHAPPEVLRMLISAGYDVNLGTLNNGYTPLYEAVRSGRLEAMQVLLAEGADVNVELSNGETLLHVAAAAWKASVDVVRLLVEKGADTAAQDSRGMAPLDLAVSSGNGDVERLLSGKA